MTQRPPKYLPVTTADFLEDTAGLVEDDLRGVTQWAYWGAHWQARHSGDHIDGEGAAWVCCFSPDTGKQQFRCHCTRGPARCCEHMNGEDLSCEPCRQLCT